MMSRQDDIKHLSDEILPKSGEAIAYEQMSLFDVFEQQIFHISASYEWDSFVESVRAHDKDDAFIWLVARLVGEWEHSKAGNDLSDGIEGLRVYAIVKGGQLQLLTELISNGTPVPLIKNGIPVHLVWQNEKDLEVLTEKSTSGNKSLEDLIKMAFSRIPKESEIVRSIGSGIHMLLPDMVVVDGEIVEVGEIF